MKCFAMLVSSVVMVAALIAAGATSTDATDDDTDDTTVVTTREVKLSIVNNTTTPEAAANRPAGFLRCGCAEGGLHPVHKDATKSLWCTVEEDDPVNMRYQAFLPPDDEGNPQGHNGTVEVDCSASATVTLTGSGTAITTQVTCG